ncbi:uncharacterized protein LOC143303363 isoform X2 [Bombus vancouverensis nearcticus]|uniref:uncharacterized protein LOC143303363 isoform X2 n=1 Tax=Bombus vancouverensis nearcticus TaxID=2705178 RepID=UPI00402B8C3B
MMLYYIALAIICMCDEFFNMAARVSLCWLLYMVFRKQGAITYFARKPSRMMITCSQGVHYLYYSTNSVTPPFDLSTI